MDSTPENICLDVVQLLVKRVFQHVYDKSKYCSLGFNVDPIRSATTAKIEQNMN